MPHVLPFLSLLLALSVAAAPPTNDVLLAAQNNALALVPEPTDAKPQAAVIKPRSFRKVKAGKRAASHVPGHGANGENHHKRSGVMHMKHVKRAVGQLEARDDIEPRDNLETRDDIEARAGEQYPLAKDPTTTTSPSASATSTTHHHHKTTTPVSTHSSSMSTTQRSKSSLSSATSSAWSAPTTQYTSAASPTSKIVKSTRASFRASSTASSVVVHTNGTSSSLGSHWKGVSSYYLFALADEDRYAVLDAIQAGGFKVVRIFIAAVLQNNKGSNNAYVPDLEPNEVGTYDDTILKKIDQLMYDCSSRGLKLMIACDDRYALGFWSTNQYATKFAIVKASTTGIQKVTDAATFYTSDAAISMFNNRLTHILSHKNELLGNKTWAQLDSVIYAFEPQNEPQGYMTMANSHWVCDRAAHIASMLPEGSKIQLSSGGGVTTTTSLQSWATECDALDIVSVHDYGTDGQTTANALAAAQNSNTKGQTIIMGEWGITGANKASTIQSFVNAFKAAGIPWLYWEVVKPGKAASDFEVWTDEPSWAYLAGAK